MKKIHILILVCITLMVLAACSQAEIPPQDELDDMTSQQDEPTDATSDAGSHAIGGGGDLLNVKYPLSMDSCTFTTDIVGLAEVSKYIDEVVEPNKWEKNSLPLTYRIIQYFDIPEETFREHNSISIEFNREHGTGIPT